MELLGLNLQSFIAQLVNFLILFFILKKLVFDLVLDLIQKQRKKAKETQAYQEKVAKEWENIGKLKEKELVQSKNEAEEIISRAQAAAEQQKKQIIAQAKNQADQMLKDAALEIQASKTELLDSAKTNAVNLSVKIASKLIFEFLDKEEQKLLLRRAIEKLKSADLTNDKN